MLLKNFFGEFLEIDSDEEPEEALERRYGIPASQQRAFKLGKSVFLSVRPPQYCTCARPDDDAAQDTDIRRSELICEVPGALAELGVERRDYEPFCTLCMSEDAVKERLLPYTFGRAGSRPVFDEIDKSHLEDVDEFVEGIPESEQEKILKNIDVYVEWFLDLGE